MHVHFFAFPVFAFITCLGFISDFSLFFSLFDTTVYNIKKFLYIFDFRIFQISPDALSYFSNHDVESDEFHAHITLVMSTLDKAVQNLDDLTELLPSLEKLGKLHANMGIKKEQFDVSIAGSPPRRQIRHVSKSLLLKLRSL